MTKPYKLIDLFAGAGGMTLGFRDTGFIPILAVEKERDFSDTYTANFGDHVITKDIEEIVNYGGINLQADVVIGGPPCQGFSNLTGNDANDPRRAMWRFFMDIVEKTQCKAFVVENVPNILRSAEGAGIIDLAHKLGYFTVFGLLTASQFGVPQNRKRAFIIGSKLGMFSFPASNGRQMTVREALAGIPLKPTHKKLESQPASGSDLHIGRNPTQTSLKRYALIPPGGNRFDLQRAAPELTPKCWIRKKSGGTDLFGRLTWDEPARCTIRTEFYKPEKGRYLHPSENRPITHWEAARLQTFPDSFKWFGTKIRIAIQIGNAVPPLLARAVADSVMRHLESYRARPVKKPPASKVRKLQNGQDNICKTQ